ncbi:flagellar export chaperone FliS [Candidatus Endobugula sertula]|uniref:Flagellar secretion chaperone FliS n=1 Tax=Candidatus Endobugula sertula TaxID=62101 RepID=A0A1D2QSB7_9GAMM|nr:flagellar export chaperone FliS [Candidatus Endobugula sertula]
MNAQVALKSYSDVKVKAGVAGATPHGLIQMLYDGLLERMAQLKGAIEQNNIELKNLKVNQATSILLGLRDALNIDQGNALVDRLDDLYEYIQRQLWRAHANNQPELLDECNQLITEISSAWRQITPLV